ncbi:MAG: HypC/HybG/HupF family hydrogenase formation chaperone [Thermoanaerobaculia bacterium]
MCLGVPGRVIEVHGGTALVDFWGVQREVKLDLVEQKLEPGDYIINHLGYAVRRISDDAIYDTLALYEVVLTEAGVDPIATDIFCEMTPGHDPKEA